MAESFTLTSEGSGKKLEVRHLARLLVGRLWRSTGSVLLVALVWATPLAAQDNNSHQLDTITVTSTRVTRDLAEIPLSVSVVEERQIRENPKADVSDYVKELPGVQVRVSDWGVYEFNIRGNGRDRSLILVDGVRQSLGSALRIENEAGLLAIEPTEIERIEVIKGPASALYGSDAIGGVVNVITKKGSAQPFGASLGTFFDGSSEGWRPRASLYGSQGGFYWRVSASVFNNDDLHLPKSGRLLHSDRHQEFYSVKLGYEWDAGTFDLAASRYYTWRNLPGLYVANNRVNQRPVASMTAPATVVVPRAAGSPGSGQSLYSSIPEEVNQQITAKLTLNDLTTSLEKLTLNLYARKYLMEFDYYGFQVNNTTGVPFGFTNLFGINKNTSLGGSLQADLALGLSHRLTVGVDVDRSSIHSQGDYEGAYAVRGRDEDRKGYALSLAAFAQDEWRLMEDLTLTTGLRYSYQKTALTDDRSFPDKEGSSSESAVVGSLGLVYDGIEGLSLRGLVSQGFRAPSLTWKYGGTSQRFIPNPDLGPEKSLNFELGARYSAHNLNLDLALFYSKLKDAFLEVDSGQINPVFPPATSAVYENADNAKSMGAELAVSYEFQNIGLTPYLSLTAMRFERTFRNGRKTDNTGVPRSWGTGGFRYSRDLSDTLRFFGDASLTWSDGYYTEPESGILNPNSVVIYGSGFKADVTIGLEGGDKRKYRGSLSFRNIGDRNYQPNGFFQPGFHVVADIGFEF
jgi:hemoglobin/transferrin/lactoferrin receptor protein